MDSSAFFNQGTFAPGNDPTLHNISPSHQSALNLNHSNSETSINPISGSAHHLGSDTNNISSATGNNNERSSPLHLASMLHTLSLGGGIHNNMPQTQQQQPTKPEILQSSYLLILKNLPQDITLRESYAIFALANGVVNIDLIKERKNSASSLTDDFEVSAIAKFVSLQQVTHYASILSSKTDVFGPSNQYSLYVEVIDEVANQQIHFERPKFGVPQANYQLASATVPVTPVSAVHQQQQQQQSSPIASASARPSLLQTRSRFSFNDPFSSDQKTQQMTDQQQNLQTKPASSITHSRSNQDSSSTDVGKSFLLLENDDINDSIWGSNAMPSSMNGFSSTPQPSTPILEWGTNNRKPSSSFFLSQGGSANGNQQTVPQAVDVSSAIHGIPGRASTTASIATPFNLLGQISTNAQPNIPNAMSGTDAGSQRKHNVFVSSKQQQQDQQKQQPHQHQPQSQQHQQSMQEQTVSSSQSGTPQKNSQLRGSVSRGAHPTNGSQKGSISNPSSSTNVASSSTISQADLSLLARVPPPANPADQNPPCNTLYVGNLPPDTTEQELRHLFSGQQGFRRLSFRNKNSNGNGHGPMCFVEFEDVSYATRALAELYGSQLPRASASNKGGIRLSFSKNPLGVRGPNNRRNGSNTSVNSPNTGNSGSNSGFTNYNYPAGFNKG